MKRRNREEGAALVEFGIVLPILLIFIFGILEFGLYMYNRHVITNANREGARFGIILSQERPDEDDIEQRALTYCEDHLVTFNDSVPSVNVSPHPCDQYGDTLIVSTTYQYGCVFLPYTIPIQTEATMDCE